MDHCAHSVTGAGNGKDRRLDFFIHDLFDDVFDFVNLGGQLLNKFNGVLKFERFRRHKRVDRVSCSFTKADSSSFFVSVFGILRKQSEKPCKVCGDNSIDTWEYKKQSIDGRHMKRRNKLFQFWEKNTNKP